MKTSTATNAPRGLDGTFFVVEDMDRARKFYEEGLGFKVDGVMDGNVGVSYELPNGDTFGIGAKSFFGSKPVVMISVEDVAAATKRVPEFGGRVIREPFESSVCVMSHCEDPEGNAFALHHRNDGTTG